MASEITSSGGRVQRGTAPGVPSGAPAAAASGVAAAAGRSNAGVGAAFSAAATASAPAAVLPSPSHVFPADSGVNRLGHLEVGGCDVIEIARQLGTPAYVVAEQDLRSRAREFLDTARRLGHERLAVVFASKAFPCTAVLRVFAEEGLWCDVASGGELHLALKAGFAPERLVFHGNAKSQAELRMALRHRVGFMVIDNFDELDRLEALVGEGALADRGPQPVLVRVTPDVRGETHEKISTGQADSKFGFAMADAGRAIERVRRIAGLQLAGVHAHIGSQLFELDPFRRAAAGVASLGEMPVWDLGGGLGVAYTVEQRPPTVEEYLDAVLGAAREHLGEHRLLLIEPGRSLVARAGVTVYTVESVKRNVSTWVAVDGGMSDNPRPMLYDAVYEAHVADRLHGGSPCVLVGKHCESGDVIVRRALLDAPAAGDIVVTPATGAYTFAMASNYNGVPRPPVVFCRDGDARVVVRRESHEDLGARDVV